MKNMFDDFMRDLAERQRRAERSQNPDAQADEEDGATRAEGTDADADRSPASPAAEADTDAPTTPDSEPRAAATDERASEDDDQPDAPPPIRRRDREPQGIFGRSGGGGGGNRPPRPRSGGGGGPRDGERRSLWRRIVAAGPQVLLGLIGILLLAAVLLVGTGIELVTDSIWFQSVGFESVFWTRVTGQAGLFVLGLVLALVFFFANLLVAGRLAPPPGSGGDRFRAWASRMAEAARGSASPFGDMFDGARRPPFGPGGPPAGGSPRPARPAVPQFSLDDVPDLTPLARGVLAVVAVLAALGTSATLAGNWETLALWMNRVPYAPTGEAVVDPVFGRDVSFYFFEYGALSLFRGLISGAVLVALGLTAARYLVAVLRGGGFPVAVRAHLAILGGAFLLTVAAGYQLDKLGLVYSTNGFVEGVSYTDQAARFFAFDALTIVSAVVGVLLVFAAFTRWLWPAGAGVVVWLALSLLLGGLYPEAIQRLTVDPNQLAQERPYIQNNIGMTSLAYGIRDWEARSYRGDTPITAEAIASEEETFLNARLWDYRPLQTTLDQLQTVRQYYDFVDIDTDRYRINERNQQVMLGARELAPERNPQQGSWVNQRIVFTHGFGIAMVPVNRVDAQGLPELIIRDLPPVASAGAPTVTEPRIYFGERPNDWVVVGARQAEFDYPLGTTDQAASGQQIENRWAGKNGIRLDSILNRLLFAGRFRDLNLLISDQITAESQLLMHRSIGERLNQIAPFLVYDKDPYVVVNAEGRLVYIQDAYTVSDRFPNAQYFDTRQLGDKTGFEGVSLNYVRNSVKVVMDAYDGTMTLYVADPSDPLIRAWSGVFPTLFKSLDTLPEQLRGHLRYPEELFNIQTLVYARYHVTDPAAFYQGNDLWTIPTRAAGAEAGALPQEAYYVTMRMPGEQGAEFLLLQPMVPQQRPNMIAWIAARNDAENYGKIRVYQFPEQSSVFGPTQIEGRISQDPVISSQVSLWDRAGSRVVYGNLIVVPVQDSVLYLQPIYLQAAGNPIPEFTKIVVASPTVVAWGDTLAEALTTLLAGGGAPTPTPTPGPGTTPGPTATPRPTSGPGVPTDTAGLIAYANEHYDLAQRALREGDFATYGVEIAKVEEALRRLQELTMTPAPVVTPAPAPTPVASPTPAP